MSRTPIEDRPALAQWLIRARASRGDDYTAEVFLGELRAEAGTAPNIATYRQWESGATTPKAVTLAPVIAFWTARGVTPPSTTSGPPPSLEERAVLAAERQAAAMELHVALLARQTMATEAIARQQGARLPSGAELEAAEDEILAYGRSLLDRMLSRALLAGQLPSGEG